jgi:hypothetical protein
MFSRPINWLLSIILLGIFAMQGYWIAKTATRQVPFEVNEVAADPTEEVEPGGALRYRFVAARHRICLVDTDRFIVRRDNGVVIHRERVVGSARAISTEPQINYGYLSIPPDISPGRYLYRAFIYSNCGASDFHALQQPDMPFTVVP